MGQTLCLVITELNFRAGIRGKGQNFNNKKDLLAYCKDDVIVLTQARCAFWNLILKSVKMELFRQAINISSICNKVFRAMFLKTDPLCIIVRGFPYRDSQYVETIQWLAYIGRTHGNNVHAGIGREFHQTGVTNVKVDWYCTETIEV